MSLWTKLKIKKFIGQNQFSNRKRELLDLHLDYGWHSAYIRRFKTKIDYIVKFW